MNTKVELVGVRQYSADLLYDGHRTYKVVYVVGAASGVDPLTAEGLPKLGSRWKMPDSADSEAALTGLPEPKLLCEMLGGGKLWELEYVYSTEQFDVTQLPLLAVPSGFTFPQRALDTVKIVCPKCGCSKVACYKATGKYRCVPPSGCDHVWSSEEPQPIVVEKPK